MRPEIRPIRPADMDSFVELCSEREGLGRAAAERRGEVVEWLAFRNPEDDGNPTYFVVDAGGRVMGHLGRMPTRFGIEGRPHRASYIHDLFVHPELQKGGRGFFLATKMYRAAERASPSFSVLVWTNEINLRIQKARQYEELWVPHHVKLLRADGQIDRLVDRLAHRIAGRIDERPGLLPEGADAGLAPLAEVGASVGKPVAAGVLQAVDRVLGMALRARRRIEPVERFDERFDALAERMLPRLGIAPVKTARYLNWKHMERPHLDATAFAVVDGAGALLGFTVVSLPTQSKYHDAYLLELVADPEDTRTIAALAVQAADHCRAAGAYTLECVVADPRFGRILRQLMFLPHGRKEPLFRANSERYERPELLGRLTGWHFSYGDSEGPV